MVSMQPVASDLELKKRAVISRLAPCHGLLVALSGGVDSAVLLSLALTALGRNRVLAVTGFSPSLPSGELEAARRVARALAARHETVVTHELKREGYRANTGQRCFHCRLELFEAMRGVARRHGLQHIAYGAIKDDEGDFRPGMRAAEQLRVLAPLQDAGMTKEEVRALAAEARLEVQDKPAAACLSSRIPVGTPVTPERLAQVDSAESALRQLGFRQVRVRHHGDVARLELDPEGDLKLREPELRLSVVEAVRRAGFRYVALDLEGYRSGSLNPSSLEIYRGEPAREGGQ